MKIRNRWLIRALAFGLAGLLRIWFWTVRVSVYAKTAGTEPNEKEDGERYLYCIWHDGILGAILCGRSRKMAGLVSPHADGSFVAELMKAVGIHPIRGSSNRRAAASVREMMQAAKDWNIAIATDGPRGPRRVVKSGILYLASRTGRRIVPVAFDASSAWRPQGRWTDMTVPWPFRRAYFLGGEPISVPPNLDRDGIELYRHRLQTDMDALAKELQQIISGNLSSRSVPVVSENDHSAADRAAA